MRANMAKRQTIKKQSDYTVIGPIIFGATMIVTIFFFWWLLIYDHGVVPTH